MENNIFQFNFEIPENGKWGMSWGGTTFLLYIYTKYMVYMRYWGVRMVFGNKKDITYSGVVFEVYLKVLFILSPGRVFLHATF